jgi:hypothetical protein
MGLRRFFLALFMLVGTSAAAVAQSSSSGQSDSNSQFELPHSIIFYPLYNVLKPSTPPQRSSTTLANPPQPSYGNGIPVPPQNLPNSITP